MQPFVWQSENFTGNDIFSGMNTQTLLTMLGFEQIEAITNIGANKYFITSESFNSEQLSEDGKLISLTTNDPVLSIEEQVANFMNLYPNPVGDVLMIDVLEFASVEIYDAKSALVYKGAEKSVNVSELNKGFYLVKIILKDQQYFTRKIIKD